MKPAHLLDTSSATTAPTRHDVACLDLARARFLAFCRFNPSNGCVYWTGAKTSGRGHSVKYGSFWYNKRRWFAHRWSARFILGLDIEHQQVDHLCQNALCVLHLQAISPSLNRELQWLRVQRGWEQYEPPIVDDENGVPFYVEPSWLRQPNDPGQLCPF